MNDQPNIIRLTILKSQNTQTLNLGTVDVVAEVDAYWQPSSLSL